MDTILRNSEDSKTSDPLINMFLYHILAFTTHEKIYKSHTITINLKYQLQHGMKNLN